MMKIMTRTAVNWMKRTAVNWMKRTAVNWMKGKTGTMTVETIKDRVVPYCTMCIKT